MSQSQPTNLSICQDELLTWSFTQWYMLSSQLQSSSTSSLPTHLAKILSILNEAGLTPRITQLSIDRLTVIRDLYQQPRLLKLIEQTSTIDQKQLIPIVNQLITLALALPPGYNYAQSRALITAAIAYHQLNQTSQSTPLLQQASQTLIGIAVPTLKAETQWRLADAWFTIGQTSRGNATLSAVTATLKTMSPQSRPFTNGLPELLIDAYLGQGQWSEAIAAARSIPMLAQQSQQLFRIASAYLRSRQVQPALDLFNTTIDPLLKTTPDTQEDFAKIATEGIITFAQASGVTTATRAAKQLPSTQPALRAKAWLAIAGEARQQNRPNEATPALEQLIEAGKIGQKQGFGSGFGIWGDDQWSGSLYPLSRSQGYLPEMLYFIEQLNLKTEAAEFLITEAVKEKRFDEAKQLIPERMLMKIDARPFEVQEDWRWWVATVAAHEGEPQQLLALSEAILPEIGSSDPKLLSPIYIPTVLDIDPPRSDRPPLFLPDIPPTPALPEQRAIRAITLLQKSEQIEMVGRLSQGLADQAEELLTRQPTVKLEWDQHPLEWVYNLERFLHQHQQTAIAQRLYTLQVDYLKQIEDLEQRANLIPFTSSWDDPRGAIAHFIEFAETVGVAEQILVAKRVFEQAVSSGQRDIMEQWRSRSQFSAGEQAQLMLKSGDIIRYLYGQDDEILWYDQILQLMQEQAPQNPLSNFNRLNTNKMIERYLYQGLVTQAQQVIDLLTDWPERERQQQRLNCIMQL
ncbi:hypothetical protein [Lyngbya sp. PCC 8106]|uniref:hypothetical protein n=1 Tax=Lyngbya sp. (strain PCC 8106) TaxID=313612 RepID=UPI0012E9F361|nr:hypothetical protein [Lyngbya sp. PCC 8106]